MVLLQAASFNYVTIFYSTVKCDLQGSNEFILGSTLMVLNNLKSNLQCDK
jgi:hypothetical protein